MRPIPIFDTNIFGDAQSGDIPASTWRYLLRYRPGHGWPLSSATALELLAELDNVNEETFTSCRERIDLAFQFSKGRILEEPRLLICTDLLRIPFPLHVPRLPVEVLSKHMDVIRRARSKKQMLDGMVPWKGGLRARLESTAPLRDLVDGVKKEWIRRVEQIASTIYPEWRDCFEKTGRRLPAEMRKNIDRKTHFEAHSAAFVHGLLDWLEAEKNDASLKEMATRLDAVLRFTIFVLSEFRERDYRLEKHASDVFDQFQLPYLALDGITIVTREAASRESVGDHRLDSRLESAAKLMSKLCYMIGCTAA